MAYTTTTQLAEYLGIDEGDLPSDADRMLDRASELIDETVVATYDTDDEDVQAALQKATSAQVEFWINVGEEHDIEGIRGSISTEGLSIGRLPDTLAKRARRALAMANLLSRSVRGA